MDRNAAEYDAIVIGSGFGGSMVAHVLVNAGQRVLMLERGDWVPRGPHNWAPEGSGQLTPFYSTETPYRVLAGGHEDIMGAYTCVGGPSVFYGGVSMRMREADFEPDPDIVADSEATWPYKYSDLESFYGRAEDLLNVAGDAGSDPTEPYRSSGYPQQLNGLSRTSRMISAGAKELGLKPFRLPLAINYASGNGRATCTACPTCDTFACALEAKNDLTQSVLPNLLEKGLDLKTNTAVVRLTRANNRITEVRCFDRKSGKEVYYRAKRFILSAGALASPHLLLASDLDRINPGGHVIGRYLTRHCNAIMFGFFANGSHDPSEFHKQLGFHDYYFGHPSIRGLQGKLGCIQQMQTPPLALAQSTVSRPVGFLLNYLIPRLTGLVVMAEDQPKYDNHVRIDRSKSDRLGLPQLLVTHHYSKRDRAARKVLLQKAKGILRKSGAKAFYIHWIKTFSHAVGTVRMGVDPATSALDEYCQFRGLDNLFVVDGSFKPTAGGVNPSLTISANALRVGDHIVQNS